MVLGAVLLKFSIEATELWCTGTVALYAVLPKISSEAIELWCNGAGYCVAYV